MRSTTAQSSSSNAGNNNSNSNNSRIGLTLITLILCLYTFGLIESIWHLPTPNHKSRSWLRKLTKKHGSGGSGDPNEAAVVFGGTINVAKSGLLDIAEKDGDDDEEEEGEYDDNNDDQAENEQGRLIPEAKWPVSIRDEDGNFEQVLHPGHKAKGNPDVPMMLPKFWIDDPVSIHQHKLMTRELAMQIGSCIMPNEHGSKARGDDCPINERTIYVAIASYRDWQCRDTVISIFSRAKHPERVRVGVVDQIVEGEDGPCDAPHIPCKEDAQQELCKYKSQLDVFQVDAPLSIAPVFARWVFMHAWWCIIIVFVFFVINITNDFNCVLTLVSNAL